MEEIRLQPGDRFIRAGEPGEDLFLLWTGRAKVEAVLDGAKAGRYGVRDLVRGLVTSELFLNK